MGKKWRTNKISNRKHKKTKTKRMRIRGGGLFHRKVTKADLVKYLIKTKRKVIIKIITPKESILSGYAYHPIEAIFDKLEKDMTGELHLIDWSEKTLGFIIENDKLRVNDKNSKFNGRIIDTNSAVALNEISDDMIKSEQEEQEKKRILEEKKAVTPKIINVKLLDATKKGLMTGKNWNKIYQDYDLKPEEDPIFKSITVPKKEDNNWNFDFFLRCIALNHDLESLDDKQKPILKQILENDLNKTSLTYTDDASTEIKLTNPGLIYMAIPGDPKTYKGGIIYDADGKTSNHIQIHTDAENGTTEYFDETTNDFKNSTASVIMEEYLQKMFPQFKPEQTQEKGATGATQEQSSIGEEGVTGEENGKTEEQGSTGEEGATGEEGTTGEEQGTTGSTGEDGVTGEEQSSTGKEQSKTDEENTSTSKESDISSESSKKIVSSKKTVKPIKEEEEDEEEETTNESEEQNEKENKKGLDTKSKPTIKPKEQPKEPIDSKINDDLNKLLLELLKNTNV